MIASYMSHTSIYLSEPLRNRDPDHSKATTGKTDISVHERLAVILILGGYKSLDYEYVCSVGFHKNKKFKNYAISWSKVNTDLETM